MIDGGPLHGGLSSELIVGYQLTESRNIEDRFDSVVGIATITELIGQIQFQLVNTQNRRFSEILKDNYCVGGTTLPILILL